jgi:hypothetical protein
MTNNFEIQDDSFNIEDEINEEYDNAENISSLASATNSKQLNNSTSVIDDTENQTWQRNAKVAINETEKEYFIFKFWLDSGRGRSKQYTAKVYNLTEATIYKIANKNNWELRAADYDRYQLQQMTAAENSRRAQLHKQKLEEYRMQQEFIGRSLSADAAKLAALVGNTLDKFMSSDREIDIRDLPAVLNAANKAAEVGRNLQSSSLGVDQLLTALEEYDE